MCRQCIRLDTFCYRGHKTCRNRPFRVVCVLDQKERKKKRKKDKQSCLQIIPRRMPIKGILNVQYTPLPPPPPHTHTHTHTPTTRKSTLRTCWCSTGKLNVSFQMYLLLLSTTNAQYLDNIPTFYSCLTDMDVRSSNAGFYTALLSFLLA